MTSRAEALAYLETELRAPQVFGPDRLRLVQVRSVPELRLLLAEDAIVWARIEADPGAASAAPFWATAWPGGQAVARSLLDHPATVAGRRVPDVASGSGLVAIAAAVAGAARVRATDIDPHPVAAISLNARANGAAVPPARPICSTGTAATRRSSSPVTSSTRRPSRSGSGRSSSGPRSVAPGY